MSLSKRLTVIFAGVLLACTLVVTSSTRTQADTVVATIEVSGTSSGVAINRSGTFAYVTLTDGKVLKINLVTDTVVATTNVGTAPMGVALDPEGTFAYVVNGADTNGTVSKINLATDTVVATIGVGDYPYRVAINPAGTFAYVTNRSGGTVSRINLTTNSVSTITIGAGTEPHGLAINPAGTFAYVANRNSGSLSKIDLATNSVSTITIGAGSYDVAIDPAGTFAYVVDNSQNKVRKIDLATDMVVTTISLGDDSDPRDVAIDPAGTFAYVTNRNKGTVSKISLITDRVAATTTGANGSYNIAINPAGTFAYVTNFNSALFKINLTNATQSITFAAVSTQLSGAKTVALSATASSTLVVAFTSATPTVCTVSGSTVTMVTVGDCTINANQAGGSGWDAAPEVATTFTILPSPPVGEVGVSIQNGDSYVNTKQVTLNLIWPEYATAARISNDGGFAASKTQTKNLAASIDWELDDSVKGIYTKVVYVRFNGVADTTKTYSDDIILDTTAPTIDSSAVSVVSGSIKLVVKATDDITGVDKIEIVSGSTTVTEDYFTSLLVPVKDLGLAVSTASVKKFGATSVAIRVRDKAGNWSPFQSLKLPSSVTTAKVTMPKLTKFKSATAKSIAIYAKLKVLSTSKVSLKVARTSARYCKVAGTKLKGLKVGSCKVTVTVTPKKGRAAWNTVTLKVTK